VSRGIKIREGGKSTVRPTTTKRGERGPCLGHQEGRSKVIKEKKECCLYQQRGEIEWRKGFNNGEGKRYGGDVVVYGKEEML